MGLLSVFSGIFAKEACCRRVQVGPSSCTATARGLLQPFGTISSVLVCKRAHFLAFKTFVDAWQSTTASGLLWQHGWNGAPGAFR